MYRLLIVDDEEIIVSGLYEIFRNICELNLDVYKAFSGSEAIEWLSRTRMDVVLTDVNMPGIDGLQLLEHINRKWPRCYVILLTGHDEFTYVYEAIKYPNVSYILKTEGPDQVIKAVKAALNNIENEIKTEDLIHQAKNQIEQAQSLFQADYLLSLLHDESIQVDSRQLSLLGIPLRYNQNVILLIGKVNNIEQFGDYAKRIEILNTFRLLVTKYLGTQLRSICVLDANHHYIWFLQPMNDDDNHNDITTYTYLSGTLESIQTSCEDKIGTSVNFALSEKPICWELLSDKYFVLIDLLNSRTGVPSEILIADHTTGKSEKTQEVNVLLWEAENDARSIETLLRKRKAGALRPLLDMGQKEQFFDAINPLLASLSQVKSKHSNLAAEAYFQISLVFLTYINRWQLVEKLAFLMSPAKLVNIDLFNTWSDAAAYLREVAEILFSIRSDDESRRNNSTIAQVNEFIEKHLSQDLSLVRLSELVQLNPSYLSRLYKHVTGNNLSEFIEEIRMQHAKLLLEQDQLKIQEISQQVGYDSPGSFSRFFKKSAGLSPQEYKDHVKKWLASKE